MRDEKTLPRFAGGPSRLGLVNLLVGAGICAHRELAIPLRTLLRPASGFDINTKFPVWAAMWKALQLLLSGFAVAVVIVDIRNDDPIAVPILRIMLVVTPPDTGPHSPVL